MQTLKFLWHLQFWGFFIKTGLIRFFNRNQSDVSYKLAYPDLVSYYCKIKNDFKVGSESSRLSDVKLTSSTGYSYELFRILSGFKRSFRFNYLWGDVIHVPDEPTFVKSRPISGDNANSVLLPLDTYRHLRFVNDPLSYDEKLPTAVWRGACHQPHRLAFLKSAVELDFCDVADTSRTSLKSGQKAWMPLEDQLKYKVIFSIEGNDVATNLKWIMSSNSLCFSPKLVYETWFREGQLIPNVHYVEIQSDFSDIEEKFNYYMDHPEEAKIIIQNANNYVKPFMNQALQYDIAREVASQYFKYAS